RQAEPRIAERINPLKEALERYERAIQEIEGKREKAYGGLSTLLELVKSGQADLTRETGALVAALKSPTARGSWGEVTLRRVVELAGMSEHCDFTEQTTVDGEEGRLRPDMVVRLPGGKSVVVDSKAPLSDYMAAMESPAESARAAHLKKHAQAVREHMARLGQKGYWRQFDPTPDFVIMFLPGESFFSAALENDRALIEDGMSSRVVLATPTTLIVLLRSVAMSWQQEKLAENAQKISEAGKDLFDRLSTFTEHFDKIGSNLDRSVKSFNAAVRSMESRVLPGARKLKDLGAARSPDAEIAAPSQLETLPQAAASQEAE
ncbi:MAG TPA: DNA recombination protein RmuC, partial [bacterium]|nr:DNA recombination protein RmuC [bacterium]